MISPLLPKSYDMSPEKCMTGFRQSCALLSEKCREYGGFLWGLGSEPLLKS